MDLNAPLGMTPTPRRRRRVGLAAGAVVALAVAGGVGAMLAKGDPQGGEPYAVAVLPRMQTTPPEPPPVDPTPTGSLAATATGAAAARPDGPSPPADEGTVENGVRVHRGSGGPAPAAPASPGPLMIDVTRQLDGNPGSKPRAAPGSTAMGTAAKPAGPRVAIYVGGLGLGTPSATEAVVNAMPAGVTFAFLPYAAPATVDAARAKGHEVLLQLPMLNTGGGVPGPHALKPGAPGLAGDLDWAMSRFGGYVGVVNLLGAPVTGDMAAMTGVLKAAGARNLFFLDDGTSKRSLAATLGPQLNVPVGQADVVLDATADPAVVRANLDALVATARRKGQAIGMASGLPDHLPAIARFAAELATKNVTLVPVSALARRDASVALGGTPVSPPVSR